MKKRVVFSFLFIALFLMAVVSGKYICSDKSEIITDKKEIMELDRKAVNGIGISVFKAEEFSALGEISAEVIVEAEKVSLSNETPSEIVEISGTEYIVSLVNATDDDAKIKIGGSSETFIAGESGTITGLEVVLVKSDSGLGVGSAEVIVGFKKISLSSEGSLSEIVLIGGKEYLVVLISSSDTDSIIEVSKCKTGNFVEEVEEFKVEENKSLEINDTINETLRETELQNNETTESIDESEIKKEEQGFLKRLINWLIKLFRFG